MPRPKPILVACLAGLGTLLAVEGLVRACVPPPQYFLSFPFEPLLGFANNPDRADRLCDAEGPYVYRTNARGFRGPDLPAPDEPPPPGVRRLLFLGDSFLEGWKVREEALLPASTQTALAGHGLAVQSFNLSSSGYGTGQELLLLRRHGARVRPEVVVLCLYSGNDVVDNSLDLAGRTTVSTGAWVRPYFVLGEDGALRQTYLHPWSARLRALSRVYTLVDHRAYRWLYREQGQYLREEEGRPVDPWKRLRQRLVMGADLELFREPRPGDDWDRAWRTTEALLAEMAREVEALGARFLVVVIPHVIQVETNGQFRQTDGTMVQAGLPSMLESLDLDLPERRLAAVFQRLGIAAVFLRDPLRAALRASGVSSYLNDGHLNSHGHALAGALVGARLAGMLAGEAPPPPGPLDDGGPVDVLARLWSERTEVRFSEPHEDTLGYGWVGWGCDWFGLGPGWAMERSGHLVLPCGASFVLEAELPAAAPFPVEFRVGEPEALVVVNGPGPFELPVPAQRRRASSWAAVRIVADRAVPHPGTAPIGMVLRAVRRVP